MAAAELRVLAGGALAGLLPELAAQFAHASGTTPVLRYGTTPQLIAMATSGDPFDVAVVPADVMQGPAARARFVAGPTTDIARVGLAVAVRAGAPKPDIGTAEALKRTLLAARAIATIPASATGTQLAQVFAILGISAALEATIRAQPTPARIVEAVVDGEADLAVFVRNVLLAPGLDLVGPFPPEVQREVVFTAAVAANAGAAEDAGAFIVYLLSPPAAALLRARGLTPASDW
jgi:molybdate transport system substrate-binding protein